MAKWNMDRPANEDVKLHEYDEFNTDVKEFDPVERPQHYGQGNIECIDYLEDFLSYNEFVGYLRGNIGKYLHRWRYKNGLEDLNKANWYLNRLIELESKQ